jgi:uncharacterized paraquat-inducible protein A
MAAKGAYAARGESKTMKLFQIPVGQWSMTDIVVMSVLITFEFGVLFEVVTMWISDSDPKK